MTKKSYRRVGITLWTLSLLLVITPSWPHIYYRLTPQTSESLATTLANTVVSPLSKGDQGGLEPTISPTPTETTTPPRSLGEGLPPVDPTLPEENGLIIDKIGVKGAINEGEDWQKILREGIWRVPNFGTPLTTHTPALSREGAGEGFPIILAAHRWGYLDWSNAFRKTNSFYNLPKLKVGDKIQIIWQQRKFEYEVYSVKTGTEIPEYKANLILYTCQLWNSPIRFFVLANRTN